VTALERRALVRYFGSLKGDAIAITDVQAVIDNWPTSHDLPSHDFTFTAPVNMAETVKIEDVWEDFYARFSELIDLACSDAEADVDSYLREMLWEFVARVLLVRDRP